MPAERYESNPGWGGWVLRRSGDERDLRTAEILGVGQSGKHGENRIGMTGGSGNREIGDVYRVRVLFCPLTLVRRSSQGCTA